MDVGRGERAGGPYHCTDSYGMYKPHTTYIVDDLVKAQNEGKLVYCRFGRSYIVNLEKQLSSLLTSNNQVAISAKTATYLINIKKLIKDHNIESDNVV
jgi:cystathionine beta-lyase/cystathionine gamma-synthase